MRVSLPGLPMVLVTKGIVMCKLSLGELSGQAPALSGLATCVVSLQPGSDANLCVSQRLPTLS